MSSGAVVGIVSPGEMGAALGAGLLAGGARVLATVEGRTDRTRRLAVAAGLELVGSLDDVVRRCSVLLSVVPPQEAGAAAVELVARAVRLGVRPLLVDLNAVPPGEVVELQEQAAAAGLQLVDGALSGAPPRADGPRGRLLLSGAAAATATVTELPWSRLDVTVVGAAVGAASAAKMCTGGVRKGTSALVIDALLTAAAYDVLEPVEAELRRSLQRDPLVDAELAASKAWRFVPEMEAVARTQEAAGLDPSTARAVGGVFRRTATSALAGSRPEQVDRSGGPADPAAAAARRAAVAAGLRPGSGHADGGRG